MDYRALSELILMGLIGLSVLTLAVGFSVRMFLAPVVREVMDRMGSRSQRDQLRLTGRVEAIEDRLAALEGGLDQVSAARDFDRQLEEPAGPSSAPQR
jgi:hypothetical protein